MKTKHYVSAIKLRVNFYDTPVLNTEGQVIDHVITISNKRNSDYKMPVPFRSIVCDADVPGRDFHSTVLRLFDEVYDCTTVKPVLE